MSVGRAETATVFFRGRDDMTAIPNPPPRPVADWVAARRKPVAVALLALAGVFLVVAGFFLLKATGAFVAAVPEGELPPPPSPYRTVHLWIGIDALVIAGILGVAGAMSLGRLPSADPARERQSASVLILEVGAGVGVIILKLGIALFRIWFDALVKWVDLHDASEAWKPLTALLVLLGGVGLMFAAAQPARGEERNTAWIRRTVYGINFQLTVILLLFGLVALNVIVSLKVPTKLDTTEDPVYALSPATRDYLAALTQPVQVTVTFTPELMKEDDPDKYRAATDLARLFEACQEANPKHFKVKTVHPVLNAGELDKSMKEYGAVGALVELGGQSQFLPSGDLLAANDRGFQFRGEGELVRRLLLMSEDRDRTVYFTQGRGEPAVAPLAEGAGRTGRKVAELLKLTNTEVKPLVFDPLKPAVPDDAAVLVIVAPDQPFNPEETDAIRKYMSGKRANGKKGKLVVAAGPIPNREKTAYVDNNLDSLLAELGVVAENKQLVGAAVQGLEYTEFPVTGVRTANPLARMIAGKVRLLRNVRELTPKAVGGLTPVAIWDTVPPQRVTWRETDPVGNRKELYEAVKASEPVRAQKRYSDRGNWTVAVAVTEPGEPTTNPNQPPKEVGRAVVFGSGDSFLDATREGDIDNSELLQRAVNWLRERPAVAAQAGKPYGVYPPLRAVDTTALLWLPVGITLLSVVALGLGVWSFRRK